MKKDGGEEENMNIQDAEIYLKKNTKKQLTGGKSGAFVYDIGGRYVLKQVYKAALENDELYEAYQKEAQWYVCKGAGLSCLPEVLDLRNTKDEISILMKQYRVLSRQKMNMSLLQKIMRALALVHTTKIPELLKKEQAGRQLLSQEQIRISADGWYAVLKEHPGIFDGRPLEHIAETINKIISWHGLEENVLIHGDFHWDNLLMDDQGRIIICDWQGVGVGAASGDLSFFLGRLRGEGIQLKEQEILDIYGQEMRQISGKKITGEELYRHIQAANVITSFTCWYQYLQGSSEERVREIYGKMAADSGCFC